MVAHAPATSDGPGLSPDQALVWRAGERQMIGTAILPAVTLAEALETTRIHRVAGPSPPYSRAMATATVGAWAMRR